MIVLSQQDRESSLWQKIEAGLNERLQLLRAKNDNDADAIKTADTRGRISEVKSLIALGKEPLQVKSLRAR